jgi:hypothetical protein
MAAPAALGAPLANTLSMAFLFVFLGRSIPTGDT